MPNDPDDDNVVHFKGFDEKYQQKQAPVEALITSTQEAYEWVDKRYACCVLDGKFRVWDESVEGEIRPPMTKRDFLDSLEHRKIQITSAEDGKVTIREIAKMWLGWRPRRTYHKIVFDPSSKHDSRSGVCNLWRGFAYSPKKGNCWRFLRFLRDVICAGNKKHYRWLCAWLAQIVQQPHIKRGTAIVLIAKKGAGKSFFGKKIRKLFGQNITFKTARRDDLFGNWNDHLEHSLFTQLEEAIWAGSYKEMSELNEAITGDTLSIQTRFHSTKQSLSIMRFLLNANPGEGMRGWTIPATFDERRYSALYVSEAHLNQKVEYFDPIDEQLENGGYEALMYFLMHFPYQKYNLTRGLETEALRDQKARTAMADKSVKGWWIRYSQISDLPYIDVVDQNDMSVAPIYKTDESGKHVFDANGGIIIDEEAELIGEYYYVGKLKLRQEYAKSIGKKVEEIDEVAFGLEFNSLFPELDENGNIVMINEGRRVKTALREGKSKGGRRGRMNIYKIPKLEVVHMMLDKVVNYHNDWDPEKKYWAKKEFE
jgi:hypothetical protein